MYDPDKIFDGLLVLQFKAGKKKALGLLVERHHHKMCKHAYWYTKDMAMAQDVVQDAWGKIIIKVHTLKDVDLFGCWALRIVTRGALDTLNKRVKEVRRRKELKDSMAKTEDEEKDLAVKTKLKRAIECLSLEHRQVLKLFYTQNYSLKEISQILEISEGTVKSRLFHAREKLKVLIK